MGEAESRERLCTAGVVLALNPVVYQRVRLYSHGRENHRSTSLSTGKAGGWCLRVGRVPASPHARRDEGSSKEAAFYFSLLGS